jgi:hypothetical protein
MTLLLLALVVCWIAVAVVVAMAVGRASALADAREAERRAARPLVGLRRQSTRGLHRAA